MPAVRASLAMAFAGSYFGLLLQLAVTAYVARVLTPAQTGVLAVASVFTALAAGWRDFGVAEFLIQRAQVTPELLRALLAVNMVASWAMAALLAGVSPLVAAFYGEPDLAGVMAIQALGLLVIPFGAVTLAWHRREMAARPLFISQVASHVVQAAATVAGVAAGWGVYALAWSGVAGVLSTVLVALVYRPAWFPRWPSWRGTREVLHFGRFASGVFVAQHLGRGGPDLVVGRVDGLAAAGMFSRANGVVELFNRLVVQAVQPVCMPYLAQSHRQDGALAPGLLRASVLLTGVGWPCLALLGLAAYPAVRVMYGPQWLDAVPVAQALCAVAAVELAYRLTDEALFALGDARRAQWLLVRVQGLRVLGVLMGVALGFGLGGAAVGLLAAAALGALLAQQALTKHAGVSAAMLWASLRPSLWLAMLSASPVIVLHVLWPVTESNAMRWGGLAALLGLAAWGMAARVLMHPAWFELQRVARRLRKPAGAADA
jgi:O-antigen/teichoic acid export membrane protein